MADRKHEERLAGGRNPRSRQEIVRDYGFSKRTPKDNLSSFILTNNLRDANQIGVNYGPTIPAHHEAASLVATLEKFGIPFETHSPGDDIISGSPTVVVISGPENRQKFLEHGGVIGIANTLKGVAFSASERPDGLNMRRTLTFDTTRSDSHRVIDALDLQGIKYKKGDSLITITDETSQKGIALSGGLFQGSDKLKSQGYGIAGPI